MCAQSYDVQVKDFESLDDVDDVVRTDFWKASEAFICIEQLIRCHSCIFTCCRCVRFWYGLCHSLAELLFKGVLCWTTI